MEKFKQIHRVNIVYKPEPGEDRPSEESISFSSAENAREFARRQQKLSQVISVKHIGGKS